jgi:hypothetical protein
LFERSGEKLEKDKVGVGKVEEDDKSKPSAYMGNG